MRRRYKKMNEFENLKVGDKVIVGGVYINRRICTVEKVTKRFIIVEGTKYSRTYGWVSGCSGYASNHIRPATEEDIKRVEEETEKRQTVRFLKDAKFEKFSFETLKSICELVEKEIGNSAAKQ